MSLTSILKRIDKVNERQRAVEQRYNRKSKRCPRKEDLKLEEQQDKRIYGYSHSEVLKLFKQKPEKSEQETRPCTAINQRIKPTKVIRVDSAKENRNIRRAQSAAKAVVSYKQQYNFLFKEDIFDQNHEKMRHTMPLRDQDQFKDEKRLADMFKSNRSPPSVSKLHSKSIKAQKLNFINSFDDNIGKIQKKNKKTLVRVGRNQIIYEKKGKKGHHYRLSQPNLPHHQFEDVFRLTNANDEDNTSHKLKIVLTSSLQNLKSTKMMLATHVDKAFNNLERQSSYGRSHPLYETNFVSLLPSKFTLTCIVVSTLHSVKFDLMVNNGELILEQSKESFDLQQICNFLLASHSLIHICFHCDKQRLIYEQFLANQALGLFHNKQNQASLLVYYLKRFLLFDEITSIEAVQQSTQLLFKANIDIPDDFVNFIDRMGSKTCQIFDADCRFYCMNLRQMLMNSLGSVLALKKELGLGQKVVKLRHGTRAEFTKFLYSWEYFYICSFTIIIQPQVQTSLIERDLLLKFGVLSANIQAQFSSFFTLRISVALLNNPSAVSNPLFLQKY